MQNLYYNSGSGITSSLLLIKEDGTPEAWTGNIITNLIVSGTVGEIIAYSGSNKIVAFPIDNTNIYYGIDYTQILYNTGAFNPPPLPTSSFTPLSSLQAFFYLLDVDGDIPISDDAGYYISSSNLYTAISGSNAYIKPPSAGYTSASGSIYLSIPSGSYELGTFLYLPFLTYTSYITIYDVTTSSFAPTPIVQITGSINSSAATASIFLSASHFYNAYLIISGTL
jgi:hypothetical protein